MGASAGGMGSAPTSIATAGGQSTQGGFGGVPSTMADSFGGGYGGGYPSYGGGYSPFRSATPFQSQAQSFYGSQPNVPLPSNPVNPNQPVTRSYTYTPQPTMQQNEYGEVTPVESQPITMTYNDPYGSTRYNPNQQVQNLMVTGSPVQQQIATAYQQMFGRAPDVGGANFWTGHFQGKNLPQQEVNRQILMNAGGTDIGQARDYALSQMRGVRPSSTESQFYQPVYQSQYTNYNRSPFMYSPSYSSGSMGNPFAYGGGYGYGGNPYQTSMATPFSYQQPSYQSSPQLMSLPNARMTAYQSSPGKLRIKEGGHINYDGGIASLGKGE